MRRPQNFRSAFSGSMALHGEPAATTLSGPRRFWSRSIKPARSASSISPSPDGACALRQDDDRTGLGRLQHHRLDAEAGIDLRPTVRRTGGRSGGWRQGSGRLVPMARRLNRAVDPVKGAASSRRAPLSLISDISPAQLRNQPGSRSRHVDVLAPADRFGENPAAVRQARRSARGERSASASAAEHPVQPAPAPPSPRR